MAKNLTTHIPQADRLEFVRELVQLVSLGITNLPELSEKSNIHKRNAIYCLHAGKTLGFLDFEVTRTIKTLTSSESARALLDSNPFSQEERDIFRAAIQANQSLISVTGDFLLDDSDTTILTSRLVAGTGFSNVTAARRATTLVAWRRYLSGYLPQARAKLKRQPKMSIDNARKREPGEKDHRAVALAKLWLRSVEIPFQSTEHPDVISVTDHDGQNALVQILLNGYPRYKEVDHVIVGGLIIGRKLRQALVAFDALQLSLGYEPKMPVDRGKIPELKLSNGQDFDLTAFRHTEFRRVPNPDPEKLKAYEEIIMRTVWKFWRENAIICQDHMLEPPDLKTYAMVWTTTFLGMSEIEDDKDNENVRLLYTYLGQRFHEFRQNLMTRARSILSALDDAHLGQHGTPYEHGNKNSWESQEADDEEESLIERRKREWRRGENFKIDLSVKGSGERRDAAMVVLDDMLGSYAHDDMVRLLKETVDNMRVAPDARTEAAKRLRIHSKTCSGCVEIHEDISGGNTLGVVKQISDGK